jgi:manganese/iron transport system substrate-binding protein
MHPRVLTVPRYLLIATVMISTLLSACGPATTENGNPAVSIENTVDPDSLQPVPLAAGQKLRIVTTTNIIGDVVSHIGADKIELTTLMATGIDPHSYVPTPADAAAINDADVVFVNGAGLEANLTDIFESAGGDAIRIYLSQGLELRDADYAAANAGDEHGHEAEKTDPHVWFDVKNVIHWVDTIQSTLSALDPANAETYQMNAQAYTSDLEELDAWVVDRMATIPEANRKLVTNHLSFGYLADRYGLVQIGAVYPLNPSSEPSARDIAALQDTIREYDTPAIFTESTVNPKLAQQVAEDTGRALVPLYSGSLGGPGSGAETYIQLIRTDVNAIVEALQ